MGECLTVKHPFQVLGQYSDFCPHPRGHPLASPTDPQAIPTDTLGATSGTRQPSQWSLKCDIPQMVTLLSGGIFAKTPPNVLPFQILSSPPPPPPKHPTTGSPQGSSSMNNCQEVRGKLLIHRHTSARQQPLTHTHRPAGAAFRGRAGGAGNAAGGGNAALSLKCGLLAHTLPSCQAAGWPRVQINPLYHNGKCREL